MWCRAARGGARSIPGGGRRWRCGGHGREASPVSEQQDPMGEVIADVVMAAAEQDKLWGERAHPDGAGQDALLLGHSFVALATHLRTACERAARDGTLTWAHIVLAQLFGAMAETDPAALRGELAQAAAVLLLWVRAIDRREDARRANPAIG